MIHKSTSINEVIARVIRNTRIQDNSYILDMMEWIPEAMGYMRTKMELSPKCKPIDIHFHKGRLPCGLVHLEAVVYENTRMRYNTGIAHNMPNKEVTDLFISVIGTEESPNGNAFWKSTINPFTLEESKEKYSVEMDYINTSICDGTVYIYYLSLPLDSNDLPLIPDNENYKEAIYYYCRAKMIGSGYKDSVFSERELIERFENYAARAMAQITYPSIDIMQERINSMVRLIPSQDYWDNMFNVSPEKVY
jgi:hypothetical protein